MFNQDSADCFKVIHRNLVFWNNYIIVDKKFYFLPCKVIVAMTYLYRVLKIGIDVHFYIVHSPTQRKIIVHWYLDQIFVYKIRRQNILCSMPISKTLSFSTKRKIREKKFDPCPIIVLLCKKVKRQIAQVYFYLYRGQKLNLIHLKKWSQNVFLMKTFTKKNTSSLSYLRCCVTMVTRHQRSNPIEAYMRKLTFDLLLGNKTY